MTEKIPYREAILRQPAVLAASRAVVRAAVAAIDPAPLCTGRVVLTGIGASLYAAQAGAAHLRSGGVRAVAMAAAELCENGLDIADVYVAVSASGRSVEPARAMEMRPGALSYGIAKQAGSPLARVVRGVIPTGSGRDSTPNTTSFTGSLLALGYITDRVMGSDDADWEALPAQLDRLLDDIGDPVARLAATFRQRAAIDCVGQGVSYGIAGYAALMLREAARIPAQSWDTLNFLHGPMEPNGTQTGVLVFGDGREVKLAQDLAAFGIPTGLITTRGDVRDRVGLVVLRLPSAASGMAGAIHQAIPAQLIAGALADAAGLPECVFRYRQSDTKLALAS
jgi:glucosamine--fructose-6-phosphate aminotransferase (isomerizing)